MDRVAQRIEMLLEDVPQQVANTSDRPNPKRDLSNSHTIPDLEERVTHQRSAPYVETSDDIHIRMIAIIVDELGVDESEVTPNARFIDDLGVDSLDTVELIMRAEEEFNIEVSDEESRELNTVGEAFLYLKERVKNV